MVASGVTINLPPLGVEPMDVPPVAVVYHLIVAPGANPINFVLFPRHSRVSSQATPNAGAGCGSVSYTHLDVYKRQTKGVPVAPVDHTSTPLQLDAVRVALPPAQTVLTLLASTGLTGLAI